MNKINIYDENIQNKFIVDYDIFDDIFDNFILKYRSFFILLGILSLLLIICGLIYYISKYKKCRESKVCIMPSK